MATINISNLTFTHRGDYDGSTAYAKNDVIYYSTNGNAYIAKQATTGNVPTNGTYWSQFAAGSGGIWNAGLSLGSAGQAVRVNSGANALEFYTPSGGGVLQLKHAHKADTQSYSSGATGSVSGLEVTMGVLASTSNKVKITAMVNFCSPNDGQVVIRRKVGSGSYAPILIPATSGSRSLAHASPTIRDQHEMSNAFIEILDAPANATDVLKYEVFFQNAPAGSATGYINRTIEDGNNGNQERVVSTITAMEIASSIL